MFGSRHTLTFLPVRVFTFHYYEIMITHLRKHAENHPKVTQKSSHPAVIFSVLPEKMPEQ